MYGWDRTQRKKVYMGKYPSANLRGSGYFKLNDGGNPQDFVPKDWGEDREFEGSRSQEYIFRDVQHGTRVITAVSYEDALRQAESLGYTASDYVKRPRRGKR